MTVSCQKYRSFADADTEFVLIKSETPVSVDGFKLGEPTGEVQCAACGKVAAAPAYIPHEPESRTRAPQTLKSLLDAHYSMRGCV